MDVDLTSRLLAALVCLSFGCAEPGWERLTGLPVVRYPKPPIHVRPWRTPPFDAFRECRLKGRTQWELAHELAAIVRDRLAAKNARVTEIWLSRTGSRFNEVSAWNVPMVGLAKDEVVITLDVRRTSALVIVNKYTVATAYCMDLMLDSDGHIVRLEVQLSARTGLP